MAGIALLMDLLKKNPSVNGQTLHSTGLYSATIAASSAAAYVAANTPFASRALFGSMPKTGLDKASALPRLLRGQARGPWLTPFLSA